MALIALLLVVVFVSRPIDGQSLTEVQKIEAELEQLKNKMAETERNQRYAENQAEVLSGQKEATEEEVIALLARIETVQQRLRNTEAKVVATEENLYETGQELEKALVELEDREKKLDARIRLAYMTGPASYLDVLLSATSFSDFLNRLDAVEAILKQDRSIALQKKKYSQQVADAKTEIEADLKTVRQLYADIEEHKAQLVRTEKEKEVMISKLSKEMAEMEEISEEAERTLKELATKKSELEAKKKRIQNYWSGGVLSNPLKDDYRVSSGFGVRVHPITGVKKPHTGVDMAAPKGTPIYAAEAGVVLIAQSWSGYGKCVIIDHGGGMWTLYGHMSEILTEAGDIVKRGQKIGLVGSTGVSTGNHLHFEVRKNSEPINPVPYLQSKG